MVSASFVLVVSLILQFLAVYFSLRLIRLTGKSMAWSLIAAAITLMALRRGISLSHILISGTALPPNLPVELVALAISALMAIGIERITPIIAAMRTATVRLQESESRYRVMFENSPISIWEEDFSEVKTVFDRLRREGVTDIDAYFEEHPEVIQQCAALARVVDVNRAALALHGASSKEELLAGIVKTFTPESFITFREELACLWRGEMQMGGDGVVKTLAGEPRYVFIDFAVCPGYEKSLGKVFVSLTDITQRKQAEAALAASERQFRSLAENLPDNIIRYDVQGRATYINPALEKLFGISARDRLGKRVREFHSDGSYEAYAQAMDAVLASGEDREFEFTLSRQSENPLVYVIRMVAERDEHGELSGVLAISHDITELKRAERERQRHTAFLADMDRINRAIQVTNDLDTMMHNVLDEVLDIFDCEHVSLLYPCDPDAAGWHVPMERYKPNCRRVYAADEEIPMSPEVAAMLRKLLQNRHPHTFGAGGELPSPEASRLYGDKSGMAMAVFPRTGKPWSFAVLQCSPERRWSKEEQHLFEEIGRRLTDGLTSLLMLRDLRESEAKYRRIVDTAREGILTLDERANVTFLNAHLAGMLGYTPGELLGCRISDVIHEEDLADHRQKLINPERDRAENYERRLIRKDGTLLWTLVSATPIFDGDRYRGALSMVTDITALKAAELKLKQALEFTEGVINAIPDLLIEVNMKGKYLSIWAKRPELLAAPKDELLGKTVNEILPPQAAATAMRAIGEADEKGFSIGHILRLDLPQGTHWFELSLAKKPADDPTSETRFMVLSRDVTERVRMEEELRASEQRFRAIFDQSFQLVGLLSTDGTLLEANRVALQFAGLEQHEVLGKPFWETPWWSHSAALRQQVRNAVREAADGKIVRFEADHPDRNGEIHYIDFSLKPVIDSGGRVVQLIPEGRDITEQKLKEHELSRYRDHLEEEVRQRTEALRLARDAAETANKAKSVFLANMSHELRTPLNAILGFSHMMRQDTGLSKPQHETLDIINHSGEHLLKLINDVLELAKIEAGKLQLEIATFDLEALVHEVVEMMRLRAQQKGLRLELDPSSNFPRYIKGDEARLRQILVNLVSNAVKFTAQGDVILRLAVQNKAQHYLLLDVEDTGPGISTEDQQRLFKPFVQLPEGRLHVGTGLGLSIVRQFVQLMGGSISVESTPGQGSRFSVALPLDEAGENDIIRLDDESHGTVAGLAPGQPDYRILIAEDQHDNRLLLSRLMSDIGLEVRTVGNGEECIQVFKEWKPDLIWMDQRMPVMNGFEATRRIRRLPGGDKVKIVAVTASAFKEQEQELLATGMDEFIRKPYRFDEIYGTLARQLEIEFLYRPEEPEEKADPTQLSPQRLSTVSKAYRDELRAAINSLDNERISAAIQRIGALDANLGTHLSRYAAQFDYPAMLTALEAAARETDAAPERP